MSTSGVRFLIASWAFRPRVGSMRPRAPRMGPLWAVKVHSTRRVPGTGFASRKLAGLRMRFPKKTSTPVPSGWIVHRLWMGIAGRGGEAEGEGLRARRDEGDPAIGEPRRVVVVPVAAGELNQAGAVGVHAEEVVALLRVPLPAQDDLADRKS